MLYPWPYNVRQLVQLAAHLNATYPSEPLFDMPHIAEKLGLALPSAAKVQVPGVVPTADAARSPAEPLIERAALERLLTEHQGVIERVATAVGRSRRQVGRWMAHYGLRKKNFMK